MCIQWWSQVKYHNLVLTSVLLMMFWTFWLIMSITVVYPAIPPVEDPWTWHTTRLVRCIDNSGSVQIRGCTLETAKVFELEFVETAMNGTKCTASTSAASFAGVYREMSTRIFAQNDTIEVLYNPGSLRGAKSHCIFDEESNGFTPTNGRLAYVISMALLGAVLCYPITFSTYEICKRRESSVGQGCHGTCFGRRIICCERIPVLPDDLSPEQPQ